MEACECADQDRGDAKRRRHEDQDAHERLLGRQIFVARALELLIKGLARLLIGQTLFRRRIRHDGRHGDRLHVRRRIESRNAVIDQEREYDGYAKADRDLPRKHDVSI
jgi:hypothetical protein